jgi:hypothetical protein
LAGATIAGWKLPIAMVEFNPSVSGSEIGTTHGCSVVLLGGDSYEITLDAPATNQNNMKVVLTGEDTLLLDPANLSYTKQSAQVVNVTALNSTDGTAGASVFTALIYDAGLV